MSNIDEQTNVSIINMLQPISSAARGLVTAADGGGRLHTGYFTQAHETHEER
jgi:hypothetical protein